MKRVLEKESEFTSKATGGGPTVPEIVYVPVHLLLVCASHVLEKTHSRSVEPEVSHPTTKGKDGKRKEKIQGKPNMGLL